jgi:hypothetical protein
MKVIIQLRAAAQALSITTNQLFLIFFLCLALPALASAQDPLAPGNMPAIDTNPAHYPSNIWITDTMTKVLQEQGSPGTTHWAIVYATQNETQSFQVHAHAPSGGISDLSVSMSDLVNAKTGTHISASSTDIVVYIERYMNVTIKTGSSATFLNTTGHVPDILVPDVDPYYRQNTNAFPFTVAPNQNQSVWIDVHIPPTAPSGYYSGTVTVKSGSSVLASMPVVYAAWQWPASAGGHMPSTSTLQSYVPGSYSGGCIQMYGSAAGCSAYPDSAGTPDGGTTRVQQDTITLFLDHRYSDGGQTNSYPEAGSFSGWDALYAPFFNGTDAHVPGILKGAKLTSYSIAPLSSLSSESATWKNFRNHFSSNGWKGLAYYLCDEPPNGCSWSTLIANGNLAHSFVSPVIPNFVTTDYPHASANGALNTIDWLISAINDIEPIGGPVQDLNNYKNWVAANPSVREWWNYQACGDAGTCSNGITGPSNFTYPNYNVDGTSVANRAMEWITFLHGQTAELYYYLDVCAQTGSGPAQQCGYPTHPNNPIISNYYSGGWGDGTLIYYGSSSYVGTSTPLILPSMRLKLIRNGMQDYEYLHALTSAGQGAFVQQQIRSWITNSYTFETSGSGLTTARQALGTKLHQETYSTALLPPPTLSGTLQ